MSDNVPWEPTKEVILYNNEDILIIKAYLSKKQLAKIAYWTIRERRDYLTFKLTNSVVITDNIINFMINSVKENK
jgi:hypothetical protein